MPRKLTYNINRFDGGMTHNNRDTSDLSKSSFIGHMDIYRENHRAYVMPGFVSDQDYDGTTDGLKTYDIQAIDTSLNDNVAYALGKKADGTGSKIIQRRYTDTEWKDPTVVTYQAEGTSNLVDYPFLYATDSGDFTFPVDQPDGAGCDIDLIGGSAASGNYESAWQTYTATRNVNTRFILREGFNGTTYFVETTASNGLYSISNSGIASAKTSGLFIFDFASGDYTIGIHGLRTDPRRGQVLLWDAASALADQNIATGKGNPAVIGFPSNVWSTVTIGAPVSSEANGINDMTVRVLSGESPEVFYKLSTISEIDRVTEIFPFNDGYKDSMLWYAKCEIASSTFKQGVFSFGKGSINSQFGAAMLLDTSSLGLVRNAHVNGNSMWFIHNEDGSVSRLDDFGSGTYDVPGYIETLFYGANSPYLKSFEGISVLTEDLPSGGSVEVQYRFDDHDSWVSIGTSNTTGKETHNFTRANGVSIGQFREIQFKIILTGKVALKNYLVSLVEADDLPFNA